MGANKDYSDWILRTIPTGVEIRAWTKEDGKTRSSVMANMLVECGHTEERSFTLTAVGGTTTVGTGGPGLLAVFVRSDQPITVDVGDSNFGNLEDCTYVMLDNTAAIEAVTLTNNGTVVANVRMLLLKE